MTWNVTGPIAPLEGNTAWQEINRQVGATINLVNNVSNSDYRTKLATVVAGGDLPDTIYIPATPGGQSAPFAQFPDFLERSAADLTPYLSGDAVKDYPNLAAIPTRPGRASRTTTRSSACPCLPTRARHGAVGPPGNARRRRVLAARRTPTSSRRCSRR